MENTQHVKVVVVVVVVVVEMMRDKEGR